MRDTPFNKIVQHKLPGGLAYLPAARLGDPSANPALHHVALVIPCEFMEPARRRDGLIKVAQREQQVLPEKLVEGWGGEVIESDLQVVEVRVHLLPPVMELLRGRDGGDGQWEGRDSRCHRTLLVDIALSTQSRRQCVPGCFGRLGTGGTQTMGSERRPLQAAQGVRGGYITQHVAAKVLVFAAQS